MSEHLMGEPRPTVLKADFESEKRKWEFRYESQDKRLKELEATIKRQTGRIRELKAECKKLGEAT